MKTINIRTSQNVKIEFELASVSQRFLAMMLDVLILIGYFVIASLILGIFSIGSFDEARQDFFLAVFYVIIYLPFLLYTPLFEYFTKGQTIGKIAMGIRVMKVSGENASFKDYFTRWLFRPTEFWIIMFVSSIGSVEAFYFTSVLLTLNLGLDGILASVSKRSQRLGDTMANTTIIRKKPSYEYTLRDVLSIKSKAKHDPTYVEVTKFTDEDMMLIKNTIARVEKYQNKETKAFAVELANKTAEELGLKETPKKRLTFLKTVLDDYIVLTR